MVTRPVLDPDGNETYDADGNAIQETVPSGQVRLGFVAGDRLEGRGRPKKNRAEQQQELVTPQQ
jgi:hypothetical protein